MTTHETRWMGRTVLLMMIALVATACVQDETQHDRTRDQVETNVQGLSGTLTETTQFVEDSQVVLNSLSLYDSAVVEQESASGSACVEDEDGSTDCQQSSDSDTEFDSESDTETDVYGSADRYTDQLVDALLEYVFTERNIINEGSNSVTYKIRGRTVCQEGMSDYQQCVGQVENTDLRIRVTSPSDGTLLFEITVGPDRHAPLDIELSDSHLAVAADLSETKEAVRHIDSVVDSDLADGLPETMTGRFRAEIGSERAKQVYSELVIEQDIEVAGPDYGVELASAQGPVLEASADAKTETVSSSVGFNAIDVSYPITYGQYDEETEETTLDYVTHLAGLSGESTLSVGDDQLEITDIGFGDSTSWLKIDGSKAVTGDLNPNDGRSVDLTIRPDGSGDDGLVVEATPTLEVLTTFDFAHVQDYVGVADWLVDYEFEGRAHGADPVEARIGDEQVEMVAGQLDLGSVNPDASVMVDEGQCLLPDEPETNDGDSSVDSSSEPPLSYLKSGDCPSSQ